MRRFTPAHLRRLWSDDAGSATVEFAIMFPLLITVFLSAMELGIISLRHSMLERGLDMAVRDIRLGTGTAPQHDDIKDAICDFAGVLPQCDTHLRLEMVSIDMRAYMAPPSGANCIDHSEPSNPVRSFVNGVANEMMLLRACYVFTPVIPGAGLGYYLELDGANNAAMIATSAFVQEPE